MNILKLLLFSIIILTLQSSASSKDFDYDDCEHGVADFKTSTGETYVVVLYACFDRSIKIDEERCIHRLCPTRSGTYTLEGTQCVLFRKEKDAVIMYCPHFSND